MWAFAPNVRLVNKFMHRYHNPDNIVRNEPWYDTERDVIKVCHCSFCANHGASEVMERLHKHFRGSDMQIVAAPKLGDCQAGVTVSVNNELVYSQSRETVTFAVREALDGQAMAPKSQIRKQTVKVCHGPTCGQRAAAPILRVLTEHFKQADVEVGRCGCLGLCSKSNNLLVCNRALTMQNRASVVQSVERELSRQGINSKYVDEIDSILGF